MPSITSVQSDVLLITTQREEISHAMNTNVIYLSLSRHSLLRRIFYLRAFISVMKLVILS